MKHLISQSEVDAYLTCKRKHYYSFGMEIVDRDGNVSHGIQPKEHSVNLTRGIIGHETLDIYYNALMEDGSHNNGVKQAMNHLANLLDDSEQINPIIDLIGIIDAYFDAHAHEAELYQPLAVEREFRYDVSDELVFPFKPDLIMRDKKTGEVILVDHKFVYNFYQERSLRIMPQTSKYVYALRAQGLPVDTAVYNQISTRKGSKQPFNRVDVPLKQAKMNRFWQEQVEAMEEIVEIKQQSQGEWRAKAKRTASAFNCTNCPFLDICVAELEEQPGIDLMITNFFSPNKYGYGKDEDGVF